MTTVKLASGATVEIEEALYAFVRDKVVSATGRTAEEVFKILGELVLEFGPKNRELLAKRAGRQSEIDEYYIEKRKAGWEPTAESAARDAAEFGQFLVDMGYLELGLIQAGKIPQAIDDVGHSLRPTGHDLISVCNYVEHGSKGMKRMIYPMQNKLNLH